MNRRLNASHQVCQLHFERGGNPSERVNGNVFFAAFNVAYVVVVQISLFSQFLLTPFQAAAACPDVFAKDSAMFRNFWHLYMESETAYTDYSIYTVFFACLSLAFRGWLCDMKPILKFLRRIGPDPHRNGRQTIALNNCPDIWELTNGDFAVIGIDVTDAAKAKLPPTASCGPDERIVRIPRNLLVDAKEHIPNQA